MKLFTTAFSIFAILSAVACGAENPGTDETDDGDTSASGGASNNDSSDPAKPQETFKVWAAPDFRDGSTSNRSFGSTYSVGEPYCMNGTVAPADDGWYTIPCIVFEFNHITPEEWATVISRNRGLVVNVENNDGNEAKVMLSGEGINEPGDETCSARLDKFGADVTIPWESFKTAEYIGPDKVYAGQPVKAFMVCASNGDDDIVSFDFCVKTLALP